MSRNKTAALALGLCIYLSLAFAALAAESGRTELPGTVPPVVWRLAAKSQLPATTELSLTIGLPLRNQAELDELLRQLYDPGSTNFHKFLTPGEFTARFGPTWKDYQDAVAFARTNRLRVTETFSNYLVLGMKGRVADVESAFHVSLHTYSHPTEARDFYAPDAEPSVPADLKVISIEGLTDFSLPRHARLKPATTNQPAALNGSGPNQEYAGRDFRNAYVPGATLNGAGQSVAVLEFSSYFPVDITNYENIVGGVIGATNYVPLSNVVVGGPTPGTANNLEVALDIEMAVSMAPMLSQIYVYEDATTSSSLLNRIATDNLAKQVSSSWLVGSWSASLATNYDNILKNMAAQGQSFFQSAGDHDAYTGAQPLDSGITVPADSPYATIVGGTTLAMNGSGASWSSETVWNYNLDGIPDEGSGGGISTYYHPAPYWQTNINMADNDGSTTNRNIPDVALTADEIFISYNDGDDNGSSYAIGTSAAAPLWAGFCALANQLSMATNGTTLGFLNPALYNIAVSSCYARSFHDITTGNNIGTNTTGLFNAVAGYDLCTGLGTPAGTNLINALVWPPPTFTSQPVGRNVTNGVNVTLTAAASSTTPLGYFWLCNGAYLSAGGNVSGTTTNTLSITGATTNNSGTYQLVASNVTGSVTSIVAILNVGSVPTVSVTPASLTVLAGSNAVFTASTSGTAPFGYQWKRNGTIFAGAGITGTNSSVLTLDTIATNSAASYSVVVTNLFGSITSSVATLTVVQPPSIVSSSLTNSTIQCGSNNLAFAFIAAGTPPLSYQWSLDGTPVANATNTSFSLTNLHLPNHTVSIQVTNPYASLCSNAVLTVQDTIPPVITLNGSNPTVMELGSAYVDPGATATDLCMGAVSVIANGVVSSSVVGTNTIVYIANDGSGNTNTATRTVIVIDSLPPTILWSFTNLVLAANSNCVAIMPNVTGTNFIQATDLAGVTSIVQSPTNGATLPLGSNVVVIAVADPYGNTAYSTNTILVQDQTPPVITLNGSNPLTVQLGAPFTDPGASASDACSGIALLATDGAVNVNAVGTNLVTYTAVDGSGNTNTATRTVIVIDTLPPTILWSFTNLVLAANSNCVAIMPNVTGTNLIQATDLAGVTSMVQSPTNGATLPLGSNVVVIAVADPYGNTAYSTNTILVQDQTPPVITLNGSNPMTVHLGAPFTDPGASASDACSGIALLATNGAVNVNAVDTNLVTYTAVNGSGNTNTATRTVIVIDSLPPTILWSFTNLVLAANSNCVAIMPNVTGTNFIQATDLAGVTSIVQSPTNGATLPLGSNVVVIAVADPYGNTAYSTNTILVQDQTPPVITLNGSNPLTVQLGAPFTDPGASASDACSGIALLATDGAVNVNAVGTNLVTYTAVDGSGNTNTATRTVIVIDTLPPTILWSFTNLVLAANSNCVAIMPNVTGTNLIQATDLAGVTSMVQSPTNGATLPLGSNVVVIAVADPYGNTAYSTNTILVQDQTPPVITLNGSNPMTVHLGAPFTDPGASASDACSGIALLATNGAVNVNAVDTNLVTYTAVNGSGNTNTATRTVIVIDSLPPTILWSFTNLVLAANSNCVAIMPNVTGTNFIQATDLAGVTSIVQSPTNGATLPLGSNVVVIAVADPYGNTAYSTNTILVQDQTPPVITLNGSNPMTVQLGAPFTDPGASASDACSGIALLATNGAVNVNAVDTNLVTYTAVDGSGNTNTATRTVIVIDTLPPTILWSFTNLVLAANSNCVATMPNVTGTNFIQATDLAGVTSIVQSPTNGATLPLGSNVVVIAVADPYGNTAYSTNTILVQDQTPPQILVQPQSQTNAAGASASFNVAATACTPLAFLWFSNNAAITAQTNSTFILSNLNLAAAGNYAVAVSAAGGSVTSTVVTLTVLVIPGKISGIAANSNGSITLNLTGGPGAAYILETATNLTAPTAWLDVATNTPGTNSIWQFTDLQAKKFTRQFYRLILAP